MAMEKRDLQKVATSKKKLILKKYLSVKQKKGMFDKTFLF